MGVLKERNMQAVYSKTMAMLYRGTKNLANNNAGGMEIGQTVDIKPSHDRVVYKQLALTPLGGVTSIGGARPQLSCCSCVRADCNLGGGVVCGSCSGSVGLKCARSCEGCGIVACGLCDTVRACHGCGALYCGSCAYPSDMSCVCTNCSM